MDQMEVSSALACVPGAIPPDERAGHFAVARQLFKHTALETEELPDGYAVRFGPEELQAVARFIANERRCCPFLSFELSLARESGPLWLRMTGPAGTREVLQSELGLTGATGCACEGLR